MQAVKDVRERGRVCILDIEMEVSFLEGLGGRGVGCWWNGRVLEGAFC